MWIFTVYLIKRAWSCWYFFVFQVDFSKFLSKEEIEEIENERKEQEDRHRKIKEQRKEEERAKQKIELD